jgi:hypothetical protein
MNSLKIRTKYLFGFDFFLVPFAAVWMLETRRKVEITSERNFHFSLTWQESMETMKKAVVPLTVWKA